MLKILDGTRKIRFNVPSQRISQAGPSLIVIWLIPLLGRNMSAKTFLVAILSVTLLVCVSTSQVKYDRNIFNTSGAVTGTQPEKSYDPFLLSRLYTHRHETELKMFDLINEAALLRDKRIQPQLDLYGDSLGYIPSLAMRHYKYAFGDTLQLDWLLAEDAKHGFGRDSLILTVFG